jgi:hypothetical protein
MDSDGSVKGSGTTAGAITIGIAAYLNTSLSGAPANSLCGSPALAAYSDQAGTNKIFGRDSQKPAKRTTKVDPRAVISNIEKHNATELCQHENSQGPDLVSLHEGRFCDMETRQLLPLCGNSIETNCFNVTDMSVISNDKKRSAKSYPDIIKWGF